MKSMLSSVDYVVECRDFRLPLTSINPVFEEALGGKRRLIVYTKLDLCTGPSDEKRTVGLPDSTFNWTMLTLLHIGKTLSSRK